jgi:hypothetical protein
MARLLRRYRLKRYRKLQKWTINVFASERKGFNGLSQNNSVIEVWGNDMSGFWNMTAQYLGGQTFRNDLDENWPFGRDGRTIIHRKSCQCYRFINFSQFEGVNGKQVAPSSGSSFENGKNSMRFLKKNRATLRRVPGQVSIWWGETSAKSETAVCHIAEQDHSEKVVQLASPITNPMLLHFCQSRS